MSAVNRQWPLCLVGWFVVGCRYVEEEEEENECEEENRRRTGRKRGRPGQRRTTRPSGVSSVEQDGTACRREALVDTPYVDLIYLIVVDQVYRVLQGWGG